MPSSMLVQAMKAPIRLRPLHKLILIFIADKAQCDEVFTFNLHPGW